MALTPQEQAIVNALNKSKKKKTQAEYWQDRAEAQQQAYVLSEEQTNKEIEKIYKQMEAWTDSQINAFYGKYADAEGITLATAKKRVSKVDIEQYEALAEQYVKDKNFSKKANEQMRLYNATMKINRLEMLKAQIGLGLVDGSNSLDKLMEQSLTDRALQEQMHKSGILGKTILDDDALKRAKHIVNADFYNATFSDRIWGHCDNLSDEIAVQLNQGLIAGVGSREMAQRLKDKFGVSLKDAQRLAVTELARVQTEVDRELYTEQGIEEYEFMAVGPNPCEECQKRDGKVFKVKEMTVGDNAPPMHPNCHCTTAPYIDEAEYEAWLNYLEQGGSTAEWDAMPDAERQRWIEQAKMSPAEPPADVFDVPEFIPAKTKAEAEEFARQFAENVDYSGLSINNANIINEQLLMLTNKYPINKLESIESGGRGVMNACYKALRFNGKKLGKVLEDEVLNFELSKAMDKANIKIMEDRWTGKTMPSKIQKDIDKLKSNVAFGRWSIQSTNVDHLKTVVTHEYGHILSDQYFGMINKERANANYRTDFALKEQNDKWTEALIKARETGDIHKISAYANTNSHELFAECFAMREAGETLPDYLDELLEESLKDGIM